jgi:hypothetical protein
MPSPSTQPAVVVALQIVTTAVLAVAQMVLTVRLV